MGYLIVIGFAVAIVRDVTSKRTPPASTAASAAHSPPPAPAKPRPPAPSSAAPPSQPPVRAIVHDLQCQQNSLRMFEAIGEVENVGAQAMDSAWLVIGFYGSGGRLIDSANTVADIRPLLSGQRSPFKAFGPTNPEVTHCAVVLVKDGPFRDQVRFEIRETTPSASLSARPDPMQFYRCPAPDGSTAIQERPCA